MSKPTTFLALVTFVLALTASPAFAVRDDGGTPIPPPGRAPTLEELKGLVDDNMPEDVQDDNAALLRSLLLPAVAPMGPSELFDLPGAIRHFQLRRPIPGKGCFLPAPLYFCMVGDGSRGGGGAYKELQADSLGGLRYLSRLPDPSRGNPESLTGFELPTFTMSDDAALKSFFDIFTEVFHVPMQEAPDPSAWVLEKVVVGVGNTGTPGVAAAPEIHTVAGMVHVPRVLKVEGLSMPTVPVLGSHVQGVMDDDGIYRVEVQHWTRFTMPDRLADARAPSRRALVDMIADALSKELAQMPADIQIQIAYAKGSHFPEVGPGGGSDEGTARAAADDVLPDEHRYVPVLVTSSSPVAADMTEEQQEQAFSTAGVEIVTPLFEVAD